MKKSIIVLALMTSLSAFGHDMLIDEIREVISNDADSQALTRGELIEAKGKKCEFYDVATDNSADSSGLVKVQTRYAKNNDLPDLYFQEIDPNQSFGDKISSAFKAKKKQQGKYHSFRYYMDKELEKELSDEDKLTLKVKDQYFSQLNTSSRILGGENNQIVVVRKVSEAAAGTLDPGYYMEVSEYTDEPLSVDGSDGEFLKSVFSSRYERVTSLKASQKEKKAYSHYKAIRYIICKISK